MNADDGREALDLEDVREAFTASERWDGDEDEQTIVLRFMAHYSALDREIDAARRADGYEDDAPIWFQWDSERGSLVHRHRGPITDEMVDAALRVLEEREYEMTSVQEDMRAALEAAEAHRA